jgi:trigger factor
MSESVQVDQVSPFQKRLQFSVPADEVGRRLDEAFRNLGQRVNIQGFRRGKVPRKVLEQRYGKQLRGEVASDLMNQKFREAAVGIEFIGQPEVERAGELVPGAAFAFAITVQVRPEIEVSNYSGIKVAYPTVEVSEDQVDALAKRRLQGQARLVEVDEVRAVERGDLALTEIVLLEDGEEKVIESGTMINTAGDKYYPGVEALLVGTEKGATNTGTVTIAESAELAGLRGRTVELRVTVLGIQVSRVPDLSDEIASELGYEGGVDAMRAAHPAVTFTLHGAVGELDSVADAMAEAATRTLSAA